MKLVPKTIDPRVQASVNGDTVFVSSSSGEPLATLDAATWAVFETIDGQASITDIAAKLGEDERSVWRALDTLSDARLIARLAPPAARPPMMRRDFVRAATMAGGALALMAAGPIAASTKSAEQENKRQVKSQEQANKKSEAATEQSYKKGQATAAKEEAQKKKQNDLAAREQARKASAASSSSNANAASEQKNKLKSHAQEAEQK